MYNQSTLLCDYLDVVDSMEELCNTELSNKKKKKKKKKMCCGCLSSKFKYPRKMSLELDA